MKVLNRLDIQLSSITLSSIQYSFINLVYFVIINISMFFSTFVRVDQENMIRITYSSQSPWCRSGRPVDTCWAPSCRRRSAWACSITIAFLNMRGRRSDSSIQDQVQLSRLNTNLVLNYHFGEDRFNLLAYFSIYNNPPPLSNPVICKTSTQIKV